MRSGRWVLTAKQAPHRPGTAPALGLRAEEGIFTQAQTPVRKETTMTRFSFRPQLESLEGRCLPSGNAAIPIGDAAIVAPSSIPQPVTITIAKGFGDFTPGAFSASGGITDSGVYQLIDEHDTALPAPVVGTAHATLGFTGTQGAITMKSETMFSVVSFDPFVIGEDGHWLIVGGTGAYANLKGEGEFHKFINVSPGQITITMT